MFGSDAVQAAVHKIWRVQDQWLGTPLPYTSSACLISRLSPGCADTLSSTSSRPPLFLLIHCLPASRAQPIDALVSGTGVDDWGLIYGYVHWDHTLVGSLRLVVRVPGPLHPLTRCVPKHWPDAHRLQQVRSLILSSLASTFRWNKDPEHSAAGLSLSLLFVVPPLVALSRALPAGALCWYRLPVELPYSYPSPAGSTQAPLPHYRLTASSPFSITQPPLLVLPCCLP